MNMSDMRSLVRILCYIRIRKGTGESAGERNLKTEATQAIAHRLFLWKDLYYILNQSFLSHSSPIPSRS